jgi:hypothetical protein
MAQTKELPLDGIAGLTTKLENGPAFRLFSISDCFGRSA